MRWIDQEGTTKQNSATSSNAPPSRPANPMVRSPRSFASFIPRWTLAEAPEVEIPSAAVSLPAELAAPLRLGEPPVVGYVARGRLMLDLITVPPAQDPALARAVRRAAGTTER